MILVDMSQNKVAFLRFRLVIFYFFMICLRPNSYVEVIPHRTKLKFEKFSKCGLKVTLMRCINLIKFNANFMEEFGWLYFNI